MRRLVWGKGNCQEGRDLHHGGQQPTPGAGAQCLLPRVTRCGPRGEPGLAGAAPRTQPVPPPREGGGGAQRHAQPCSPEILAAPGQHLFWKGGSQGVRALLPVTWPKERSEHWGAPASFWAPPAS